MIPYGQKAPEVDPKDTMAATVRLRKIDDKAKDGRWVVLFGPSGYTSIPLRAEVCRYDPGFRPLNPWVNHSGDSFTDGGEGPLYYLPYPEMPRE